MNKHDRYFAAQRIQLSPRAHVASTLGPPLQRGRPRRPLRAFTAGVAVGAALAWLAGEAYAAPPLLPVGSAKVCEIEAMTARNFAEARDAGVRESLVHERLDKVAASHPELALTAGDIRREHASISEIWSLRHLTPDSVFAFVLHRCLFGRVQS